MSLCVIPPAITDAGKVGDPLPVHFFQGEYRLNHLIGEGKPLPIKASCYGNVILQDQTHPKSWGIRLVAISVNLAKLVASSGRYTRDCLCQYLIHPHNGVQGTSSHVDVVLTTFPPLQGPTRNLLLPSSMELQWEG